MSEWVSVKEEEEVVLSLLTKVCVCVCFLLKCQSQWIRGFPDSMSDSLHTNEVKCIQCCYAKRNESWVKDVCHSKRCTTCRECAVCIWETKQWKIFPPSKINTQLSHVPVYFLNLALKTLRMTLFSCKNRGMSVLGKEEIKRVFKWRKIELKLQNGALFLNVSGKR